MTVQGEGAEAADVLQLDMCDLMPCFQKAHRLDIYAGTEGSGNTFKASNQQPSKTWQRLTCEEGSAAELQKRQLSLWSPRFPRGWLRE